MNIKTFNRKVKQEHKEHPWLSHKQAVKIVQDHIRKG